MSETNPTPTPIEPTPEPVVVAKKPSLHMRFKTRFPRAHRAAQFTLAIGATALVTRGVTNAQHNKERRQDAVEHLKEAGEAISDSVATPDTEA